MVKNTLLSLFLIPLIFGCDLNSREGDDTLSATQREVILEASAQTLKGLSSQGYALVASEASSGGSSDSEGADLIGDRMLVEYSGNVSLAATPDRLAPAITLTRIEGLRSLTTGKMSQEKYLLTGLEMNRERSEVLRVVFTRIAPTGSADELRQLKFSSRRNDWIEVIGLAKDSSHRSRSENVYIDDAEAAQIGDLFAELQKRLEEEK